MPVAEGSNDLLVNGIGMLTGPGIGSFARGGGTDALRQHLRHSIDAAGAKLGCGSDRFSMLP
jgi:hypothetical protein